MLTAEVSKTPTETSQRTKVCNYPLPGDAALACSLWKQWPGKSWGRTTRGLMQPEEPLERGLLRRGGWEGTSLISQNFMSSRRTLCRSQIVNVPSQLPHQCQTLKEHSQAYLVPVCTELPLLSGIKDWTEIRLPWNFQLGSFCYFWGPAPSTPAGGGLHHSVCEGLLRDKSDTGGYPQDTHSLVFQNILLWSFSSRIIFIIFSLIILWGL